MSEPVDYEDELPSRLLTHKDAAAFVELDEVLVMDLIYTPGADGAPAFMLFLTNGRAHGGVFHDADERWKVVVTVKHGSTQKVTRAYAALHQELQDHSSYTAPRAGRST